MRAIDSLELLSSFDLGEDSRIGDISLNEESVLDMNESFRSLLITEVDSTLAWRFSSVGGSVFCGVHGSFMNDENFGPASCFTKTGLMADGNGTWLRFEEFSLLSENKVSVARMGKEGIFLRGLIGVLSQSWKLTRLTFLPRTLSLSMNERSYSSKFF